MSVSIEFELAQEIIRTEGDGMEFIKDSLVESNMTSKPSNSTENNRKLKLGNTCVNVHIV